MLFLVTFLWLAVNALLGDYTSPTKNLLEVLTVESEVKGKEGLSDEYSLSRGWIFVSPNAAIIRPNYVDISESI